MISSPTQVRAIRRRPARKGATIADVARRAGVSAATVSYVLNGRDRQVSEATRERVLAAARESAYRPNALARSLARQRTATIGLVLAGDSATTFFPMVRGVSAAARSGGSSVLVATPADPAEEALAFATFLEHQVAGVIYVAFSQPRDTSDLRPLLEQRVPLVVVNRPLPQGDAPVADGASGNGRARLPVVDAVHWDNRAGARMATDHLLALGHRRLGYVSRVRGPGVGAPHTAVGERLAGFQDALGAAGGATGLIVEPDKLGFVAMLAAIHGALERPAETRPTALVCFNDAHAAAALRIAGELGLRVPRDLAITGFNDSELAALSTPSITSVALPAEGAGRHAVGLLQRRLRQPDAPPARELLSCALVVRESCGGATVRKEH